MIDYLYWRIYTLFNKWYFFSKISKLEYRASALLGTLLLMNLIAVGYLLNYPFFETWGRTSILIVITLLLAVIFYYARSSKIEKLKKKFKGESDRNILKGNVALFVYIIASFLLFSVVAL